MRILMLNNEYPPLGGGTATVNEELLRQFATKSEYTIDLVTSANGSEEELEIAPHIRIIRLAARPQCLHHATNRELVSYAAAAYRRAAQLHAQKPYDLCFAWCTVPAGAVALALRLRFGLPYIVRVSGPDIPGFERRYRRLYPILSPLIRLCWRSAESVIAKCEPEAALVTAADRKISPVVINNGVDLQRFLPRAKPAKSEDAPLQIICVGRLIERKGQQHLIHAARSLKEKGIANKVHLIGTGDAELHYRELVRALELSAEIDFHGAVSREEMPELYAKADAFVLPSENEGMSVATLEALASGLPLLLTPTPGSECLLAEGENGYFVEADNRALAERLAQLAADSTLVARMGEASRRRAQQLGWPRVAEQYCRLFAAVLEPGTKDR